MEKIAINEFVKHINDGREIELQFNKNHLLIRLDSKASVLKRIKHKYMLYYADNEIIFDALDKLLMYKVNGQTVKDILNRLDDYTVF